MARDGQPNGPASLAGLGMRPIETGMVFAPGYLPVLPHNFIGTGGIGAASTALSGESGGVPETLLLNGGMFEFFRVVCSRIFRSRVFVILTHGSTGRLFFLVDAVRLLQDTMTEPAALSTTPTLRVPAKDLKDYAKELNIPLDFDPNDLRAKYAEEKRKRDGHGGISQYQSIRDSDFLKSYVKDLYADETFTRDPVKAVYDVVIIGAGLTGIQAVRHLHQRGITNVCVIEKGYDFGGTWSAGPPRARCGLY